MKQHHVIMMAGGTGGHVIPALEIAKAFQAQGIGVSWLGTRLGLESRLVPQAGFEIDYVPVYGVRGRDFLRKCLAPFWVLCAVLCALWYLRRRKPSAVVGMGGFASGPGGVAAIVARIPLVIHEQNAILGFTNRLLAPWARWCFASYPDVFDKKYVARVVNTGNPVRGTLFNIPAPEVRFSHRTGMLRVLVLGGSRGAQALNHTVPQALLLLQQQGVMEMALWHQTGQDWFGRTQQLYGDLGIATDLPMAPEGGSGVVLSAYIEDMAQAYAWADCVICRAGALTVSELAVVGLGGLLIPYPWAVDDHQTANAWILVNSGAAQVLQQSQLNPVALAQWFENTLLAGRGGCLLWAQRAASLGRRDATAHIVGHCLSMMGMR